MTTLLIADLLTQLAPAPTVQLDLARIITGVVATAFAMLCAVVVYFLKNILDEFRAMRTNVQTVMTVLFGPDGKNGMRSDLRKTRQLQVKHDRLLVELAAQNGIEVGFSGEDA